jgi:antitoxin Phd
MVNMGAPPLTLRDGVFISDQTGQNGASMKTVQLHEAKARFSSFVDEAIAGERVTVTRHGKPVAVIVSAEEWERVSEKVPSFADLLLRFPGLPQDIPPRSRKPLRDVDL